MVGRYGSKAAWCDIYSLSGGWLVMDQVVVSRQEEEERKVTRSQRLRAELLYRHSIKPATPTRLIPSSSPLSSSTGGAVVTGWSDEEISNEQNLLLRLLTNGKHWSYWCHESSPHHQS